MGRIILLNDKPQFVYYISACFTSGYPQNSNNKFIPSSDAFTCLFNLSSWPSLTKFIYLPLIDRRPKTRPRTETVERWAGTADSTAG